ncbi:MAG: hypothetical protein MPJ04_04930 [Nitrosopumilus sp.]|nr:hypothetical protein [Nitrosopumilus sp.]MDA7945553.1 hypothetical protein [Nitrosopumilus sp.]MDA7954883.1 hypothetical protein [Nitrosopumilus sp.]MDA7974086.1 hypothetical protein [Nitrosopumilus sp.]MDA7997935.1 hypothetical protein [Nitrosopumilus sp.]
MSLDKPKKIMIVSDLMSLNNEDRNVLGPLLAAIQGDIARYGTDMISSKLFGLGMDKMFSMLLVDSIINQAPTLWYMMAAIPKMTDSDFEEKFPALFKGLFVEKIPTDELAEKYGMTVEQINNMSIVMSWCMNGLARSELSENTIKKKCKESGLTDAKTEVLVNTFKINSNFWHNMLVFSNTQDTIRVLERIDKKRRSDIACTGRNVTAIEKFHAKVTI